MEGKTMLKEAIEKIESLCRPYCAEIDGHNYSVDKDGTYKEILPEIPVPITRPLNSLDAVITMVQTEAIKKTEMVFISVPTATRVEVFSKSEPAK